MLSWPKVIAAVMLFATILTRPSLLSEGSTNIFGCLVFFLCGLATLQLCGINPPLFRRTVISQGSAIILWLFLMFHSLLNGVSGTFMVTAFLTVSLATAGACMAFSNRLVHDSFFATFRFYLAMNGLSFLITTLLAIVLKLAPLYLTTISIGRYALDSYGDVYFPFTISYGYREFFGITLPRLGAGFRESGIAGAFYACAIVSIPHLRSLRQNTILTLLVIGGLATMSTTGIALVGIAACVRVARFEGIGRFSRIALVVVMSFFGYLAVDVAVNDDSVGFAAKENTDSYFDRRDQMEQGLAAFRKNLLGEGVYSEKAPYGVNLIASTGALGIVGLTLILLNLVCALATSFDRIAKAFFMLPLFLTSLTSQPLLDAPLIYVFFGFLAFPYLKRLSAGSSIADRYEKLSSSGQRI